MLGTVMSAELELDDFASGTGELLMAGRPSSLSSSCCLFFSGVDESASVSLERFLPATILGSTRNPKEKPGDAET